MTRASLHATKTPLPTTPLHLVRDEAEHASFAQLVQDGQAAERQGRRSDARRLYEMALKRIDDVADGREASAVLRWIARTHQVDANPEAALDCLEAALAVATAHGDVAAIGHATNLEAIVYWQQGDLDEAERLLLRARDNALRSGEAKLAAMTAQNLGVIANIRGELDTALGHYGTALADYRALGLPGDVCVALNNLGMLYTDRQQWEDASRCYEEAIGIAGVLGDLSTRIMIEVNYAECWVARGDLERARTVCDRAMDLAQRAEDHRAHGELYKMYGIIARDTGDVAVAEECLGRAVTIAEQRQDLLLLAECAKETAELRRRQNRNRDTLQLLNRAHRLFSQLRARRDLADIGRRMGELESEFLDVVRRWGESIESKDHYTQGHCERVADLACALAAKTGMDQQSLFWFRIGALLHDVGKLVIASDVLNKPTRLTPEEWALVQRHPSAGVEMLAEIDFPWDILPMVQSHHERWDGKGYPHRLVGEDIPRTARMLCIADVYDALTSERSYKRPLSHAEAIEVMRADVGTQFDPTLFSLFEDAVTELAASAAVASVPHVARPVASTIASTAASHVDELTDLPMRRAFLDRARRLLGEMSTAGVSLLVIDVDHFKAVNETFGHLGGDDALRAIATALRQYAPTSGFLARYAGDEFVLLLPGTQLEEARAVAERLRDAIQNLSLSMRTGRWVGPAASATLSIGVASAPEHAESVEALFAAADAALYDAKRAGRNTVVCAGAMSDHSSQPPLQVDRFTGRQLERRQLVELFGRSLGGEARVVAVTGEAGVGKTALVRELAPEVRLRAGNMVIGRCIDAAVRAPYAPWTSLLGAIEVLRIVAPREWHELPRLVPALGAAGGDREGTRYALFEEVTEYLRLAAATRPLVIVLDDMQWADGPSWELLEHVTSRLDRDRLLVCLTIREEDASQELAARRLRLACSERFVEVRLARLTREELRQWLELALRQELAPELLAFLYRQTEGNPFFTVQVLRAMVEESALWWGGDRWNWRSVSELRLPVAINDLLSRRLARLSASARRILAAAAVMDRALDVDLCVEAGIATEDELLDAIDEGLAASVLVTTPVRGDERVTFAHALLVDVLRDSVNSRRLKRIHERAARAMERTTPGNTAQIAVHYHAAGVPQKAYHFALAAADDAIVLYAHEEASAYLRMALAHASAPDDLASVRLRLAEVAELSGRYQEAEELASLALDWLARHGDVATIARTRRMIVRLKSLQGEALHLTCLSCEELLGEALEHGLESERIAVLTMISQAQSRLGNNERAVLLARECVELAERQSESRLVADALTRLGSALLQTDAASALLLYRQAHALFGTIHDRLGQLRCEINVGVASSRLGDMRAAEEAYERALTRGRSWHSPDLAGLAALNLGVLSLKRGRYDAARGRMDEALQLFTRVRNETHRLAAMYNLAHLAREEGLLHEALQQYGDVLLQARQLGVTEVELGATAGAGLAALSLGNVAAASVRRAEVEETIRAREDWWFPGRELVEALRIELDLGMGAAAAARRRFRHALALAEMHDIYGAMWLTARCGTAFGATLRGEMESIVLRYAARAQSLGFGPLQGRFAAIVPAAARRGMDPARAFRLEKVDARW